MSWNCCIGKVRLTSKLAILSITSACAYVSNRFDVTTRQKIMNMITTKIVIAISKTNFYVHMHKNVDKVENKRTDG